MWGAGIESTATIGVGDRRGTVVALCGRYFAGRIDLLTHERVKSLPPVTGSPFALAVPAQLREVTPTDSEPSVEAAKFELAEDLAGELASSGADFLIVDNTAALIRLAERGGRYYTWADGRGPDIVDVLWEGDKEAAEAASLMPVRVGLTPELRMAHDAFVEACLAAFDPSRIILIRSRVPRFWVTEDGQLAPTNGTDRVARFLDELDLRFIQRTGCLVSNAVVGRVPSAAPWHSVDCDLRVAIEDDVMRLMSLRPSPEVDNCGIDAVPRCRRRTAAGHIIRHLRRGRPLDIAWLERYFRDRSATHEDLLALAYLQQLRPGVHDSLITSSVRRAVADRESYPVALTRRHFERSVRALREWEHRSLRLPRRGAQRQVVLTCERAVIRFSRNGRIEWINRPQLSEADAEFLADGRAPITPSNLAAVLTSWPFYLERGRRGLRAAPLVEVQDSKALLDTCYWLDWSWVLANETVVVARPRARHRRADARARAKTDLSFIFDPRTRIGTVGGGLMDQVTHIALFDELCSPHGFDLYLDDFRYTWWRSHNGFEASRLAPNLEAKRMSRLASPALVERFRTEVVKTRLPWVFSQSRAWRQLGLREAFVVTREYFNARRLLEIQPDFDFLVYSDDADLATYMGKPPSPVTFFTTQHRIAISPASADVLGRIFSYDHVVAAGLPPSVAATSVELRRTPHVALHIRRGDYLESHFDTDGWFAANSHYSEAIRFLIDSEIGSNRFDLAVFSDDLNFVGEHSAEYGLDLVDGQVRYVGGNRHFDSIYDSYLMSLCPVVVGSVGFFAATTSLLADPPSTFIRARPDSVWVNWRRTA